VTVRSTLSASGVLELVVEHPPVNAFTIGDLHDLAGRLREVEGTPAVHCVVVRSEGRGFCGGGDLKEVQGLPGHAGILGQASGSFQASVAIAECAVPVIVAVHRYCVGVGVVLAGAADVVVAAEGTVFVLSEVDNGATAGAVQAVGLMPEKRLRTALFTCEPVAAEELLGYGTIHRVVPEGELVSTARALAEVIAAKAPAVVRAAKASVDSSIGREIRRHYRVELGYTFELNLLGEAATARQAFLDGGRAGYQLT
jgi:enoyl-CoA hydratase